MKISGLCLLISAVVLSIAAFARFMPAEYLGQNGVAMLVLLSVAFSCLGTLELKIHRRTRYKLQRSANMLASALRNGALR